MEVFWRKFNSTSYSGDGLDFEKGVEIAVQASLVCTKKKWWKVTILFLKHKINLRGSGRVYKIYVGFVILYWLGT